jgi:D-alanyl-lipoteichoic acid acyltransferase DltB (MBOAT superfamily)
MLFNSLEFIFYFLPIVLILFYIFSLKNRSILRPTLLVSSLVFYSYWDISYTVVFLASIVFNFYISQRILDNKITEKLRKSLFVTGVVANVLLLVYYKYTLFILNNVNQLFSTNLYLPNIVLPLAISFFTFQQIAYLADCYKERNISYNFVDYALFVSFFPQLIAGPIVHHSEVMPQIKKLDSLKLQNFNKGLFVFLMGLFKKVVVADYFAKIANLGFNFDGSLTFYDSWVSSLSYTIQLYFDFSGYTDMAIGLGLFFGIHIPDNFNSPYKAVNIQDFWRRWHITLSHWLRDYIYIPLGGNRSGSSRTLTNIFLTFLIGGIWHGAGWTFVVWGALHGLANLVYRLWDEHVKIKLPKYVGMAITFMFANIAWVFFRATDVNVAIKMLKSMFTFDNLILPAGLARFASYLPFAEFGLHSPVTQTSIKTLLVLIIVLLSCFFIPNSKTLRKNFKTNYKYLLLLAVFTVSLLFINDASEFIYFQF